MQRIREEIEKKSKRSSSKLREPEEVLGFGSSSSRGLEFKRSKHQPQGQSLTPGKDKPIQTHHRKQRSTSKSNLYQKQQERLIFATPSKESTTKWIDAIQKMIEKHQGQQEPKKPKSPLSKNRHLKKIQKKYKGGTKSVSDLRRRIII